jgi:hypothetical protein
VTAHADASSREPVGSVAEEAARLLGALQDAAGAWAGSQQPAHAGHETPAACRVCPLCQAIAAVQHVRPETVQHLADAAGSLAAALSDVLAGARQARTTPEPAPGTARPERPRRDDVQHIDITD